MTLINSILGSIAIAGFVLTLLAFIGVKQKHKTPWIITSLFLGFVFFMFINFQKPNKIQPPRKVQKNDKILVEHEKNYLDDFLLFIKKKEVSTDMLDIIILSSISIFFFLAYKGIKYDDDLVKSVDRLR